MSSALGYSLSRTRARKGPKTWAASSFGRALPWHGRGEGFDPLAVHQEEAPTRWEPLLGLKIEGIERYRRECLDWHSRMTRATEEGSHIRFKRTRGRRIPLRSTKKSPRLRTRALFVAALFLRRGGRGGGRRGLHAGLVRIGDRLFDRRRERPRCGGLLLLQVIQLLGDELVVRVELLHALD